MTDRLPDAVMTERVREVEAATRRRFLSDVLNDADSHFSCELRELARLCESPIEALFLAAFLRYHCPASPYASCEYEIEPQRGVAGYRVDFLVRFRFEGCERSVAVECDGHDYHERTREQAERDKRRDRDLLFAGIPVFHFTGRELHRDPAACAGQVVDYAQTALVESIMEELQRNASLG